LVSVAPVELRLPEKLEAKPGDKFGRQQIFTSVAFGRFGSTTDLAQVGFVFGLFFKSASLAGWPLTSTSLRRVEPPSKKAR